MEKDLSTKNSPTYQINVEPSLVEKDELIAKWKSVEQIPHVRARSLYKICKAITGFVNSKEDLSLEQIKAYSQILQIGCRTFHAPINFTKALSWFSLKQIILLGGDPYNIKILKKNLGIQTQDPQLLPLGIQAYCLLKKKNLGATLQLPLLTKKDVYCFLLMVTVVSILKYV